MSQTISPPLDWNKSRAPPHCPQPMVLAMQAPSRLSLSASSPSACVLVPDPSLLQGPPAPSLVLQASLFLRASHLVAGLVLTRYPPSFPAGHPCLAPPASVTVLLWAPSSGSHRVLTAPIFSGQCWGIGWEATPRREQFFLFVTNETHGFCGVFPQSHEA